VHAGTAEEPENAAGLMLSMRPQFCNPIGKLGIVQRMVEALHAGNTHMAFHEKARSNVAGAAKLSTSHLFPCAILFGVIAEIEGKRRCP
jgi:hypothetical protein